MGRFPMVMRRICATRVTRREHWILLLCGCTVTVLLYVTLQKLLQPKNTRRVHHRLSHQTPPHPLLDLPDFTYVFGNQDACSSREGETISVILIVTSYAGNIENRKQIRQSYPASKLDSLGIRRVFLLALLKNDSTSEFNQRDLEAENRQFSDLVQGSFLEAYRNLTYKHVMGLTWATLFCGHANFVVKMDDDIVVDLYQLSDLLETIQDSKGLLMGYVLRDLKPIRDAGSKWFVSRAEYAGSLYPPFLSGWLYVTTPTVAQTLLAAARNATFFWIDDTFVTGVLAAAAGIAHRDWHARIATHAQLLECCVARPRFACDFLAGPQGVHGLQTRIERLAAGCRQRRCPQRPPERALARTCVNTPLSPDLGRGSARVKPFNLF